MHTRLDTPRWSILAVVAAAVLFVSINIIANVWLTNIRFDVTQGRAFTISKQVKSVIKTIDEPITLRLYYSEALGAASPQHAALYRRIRELLQQYARISHGKIIVEYENPEPFSDTEDRAVGFGLQAIPLGDSGEVGYFGLAGTNSTDDQKVIPFFNLEREQFVEYDLAKLIYSLSKPNQPNVGLISSLPLEGGFSGMEMGMRGQPQRPWAVMGQIKDFFKVRDLSSDVTEIPPDISALVLVQPTGLSASAQYAIDQFVLRGGRVLLFIDPNPEESMGGAGDLSGIKKLMADWGVNMVDGKVVGDMDAAVRVNIESGGRPVVSDYVAWLQLGTDNFDRHDTIIGDLKQIQLGTPGALEKAPNATTTFTPLLLSGPNSELIDSNRLAGLPDVVGLFRDFKPSGKREILAARITGPVKTAFPEGPPAKSSEKPDNHAKPNDKTAAVPLRESKGPAEIVVVADTDILADRFWLEQGTFLGQRVDVPTSDNASFVVNALENLTGSPALSSLRGRGIQARPFLLIEDIRRNAELKFRTKEKALEARLDELQKKVKSIELRQGNKQSVELSDTDRATIENYRAEILSTRHELRDVQAALRHDIDRLEAVLKFINIAAVPILFGILMIATATVRRRRRRKAQ